MAAFKKMTDDRAWALMQSQPQIKPASMPRSKIPRSGNEPEDNVFLAASWIDIPLPMIGVAQNEIPDTLPEAPKQSIPETETKTPKQPSQEPAQTEQPQPQAPKPTEPMNEINIIWEPPVKAGDRQPQIDQPQQPRRQRPPKAPREKPPKPQRQRPPRQGSPRPKPPNYVPGRTPSPALDSMDFRGFSPYDTEQIDFDQEAFRNSQMNNMIGEELGDTQSVFYEQLVDIMERQTQQLALLTMRLRFVENLLDRIGA